MSALTKYKYQTSSPPISKNVSFKNLHNKNMDVKNNTV